MLRSTVPGLCFGRSARVRTGCHKCPDGPPWVYLGGRPNKTGVPSRAAWTKITAQEIRSHRRASPPGPTSEADPESLSGARLSVHPRQPASPRSLMDPSVRRSLAPADITKPFIQAGIKRHKTQANMYHARRSRVRYNTISPCCHSMQRIDRASCGYLRVRKGASYRHVPLFTRTLTYPHPHYP